MCVCRFDWKMDCLKLAEIHFKKIEELLEDRDRIVTIPYLAMAVHISMQDSQNILEQYVEAKKEMNPQKIAVTYVLRGLLRECRRKGVFIVRDSGRMAKRNVFEQVDDEVIFSIQKNTNIDYNVISLVDGFDDTARENRTVMGTIVGNNCSKRELKKPLLSSLMEAVSNSSIFVPVPAEKCMESNSRLLIGSATADVFSRTVSVLTHKETPKGNSTNKTKSGISKFFESMHSKNPSQEVEDTSKAKCMPGRSENTECDEIESSTNSAAAHEVMKKCEMNEQKCVFKPETKSKNNNKRRRDENVEETTKRRRRIVERNDSESDDMFEKVTDEDIIDKSDDEPARVLSPMKDSQGLKNRKRKAIDKTYQDEEGFIVTKTEYIYETSSEEEIKNKDSGEILKMRPSVEKKSDPSEYNSSVGKSIHDRKGKKNNRQNQPTLMNFFKKC